MDRRHEQLRPRVQSPRQVRPHRSHQMEAVRVRVLGGSPSGSLSSRRRGKCRRRRVVASSRSSYMMGGRDGRSSEPWTLAMREPDTGLDSVPWYQCQLNQAGQARLVCRSWQSDQLLGSGFRLTLGAEWSRPPCRDSVSFARGRRDEARGWLPARLTRADTYQEMHREDAGGSPSSWRCWRLSHCAAAHVLPRLAPPQPARHPLLRWIHPPAPGARRPPRRKWGLVTSRMRTPTP
jgi:hypothetical protein